MGLTAGEVHMRVSESLIPSRLITAFSFGLIWDWATVARDAQMSGLLREKAAEFYAQDQACPLNYEPSGQDFLSPCLAEADFMRRVLPTKAYAHWLTSFLPQIPRADAEQWLQPAVVTDRTDPKLAHLDGLNLSRAWMLEGVARDLPEHDGRLLDTQRGRGLVVRHLCPPSRASTTSAATGSERSRCTARLNKKAESGATKDRKKSEAGGKRILGCRLVHSCFRSLGLFFAVLCGSIASSSVRLPVAPMFIA